MKVVITIQHPAHVHFFKFTIRKLEEEGNEVYVFARKKQIALDLLQSLDINFAVLAEDSDSLLELARTQFFYETRLWKRVRKINPDVITAIGEPAVAHLSKLTDTTSIIFTDTEHATLQNSITFPFADRICTPDCYTDDIGDKQVRYPSYHELAYLHPNRFEPDPSILDDLDLDPDDKFVILRTVDWKAVHDIGDSGFESITDVVESLEKTGAQVLITSEGDIPESVEHCQLNIEPHRIHHLMYYADLFIGESGTMAAESAVLGTPAIFVNSLSLGYLSELEERYGLVFNYSGENKHYESIEKAASILDGYDSKHWEDRKKRLLEEKEDTTEFILNEINRMTDDV